MGPIAFHYGDCRRDFGASSTWWDGPLDSLHRDVAPSLDQSVLAILPRSAIITSPGPFGMQFINDDKLGQFFFVSETLFAEPRMMVSIDHQYDSGIRFRFSLATGTILPSRSCTSQVFTCLRIKS